MAFFFDKINNHAIKYIEKKLLWPYLTNRSFQAYCIGAPRSGTKSIANIFQNYRSAHEPDNKKMIEIFDKINNQEISSGDIEIFLKRRDKKLFLELESFHTLAWFSDILSTLFKESKFILPIRECETWLNSMINQHLNFNDPKYPEWRVLRDIYHGNKEIIFAKEELVLKDKGLYPIDNYLLYWLNHNRFVLNSVPKNRLYVLRTNYIEQNIYELASFIGVSPKTLEASKSHSHKAPRDHRIIDTIDENFLRQKTSKYTKILLKHLKRIGSHIRL